MLLSKRAACDNKKSKFLKEQVASIFIKFIKQYRNKDTFSRIPLLGPLFFRSINKLIQDIKCMKW